MVGDGVAVFGRRADSGVPSTNFAVGICAINEGVARLFGSRCAGSGAVTTPLWQHGQAYFGRMLRITRTFAGCSQSTLKNPACGTGRRVVVRRPVRNSCAILVGSARIRLFLHPRESTGERWQQLVLRHLFGAGSRPHLRFWVEPELTRSLATALDVYN